MSTLLSLQYWVNMRPGSLSGLAMQAFLIFVIALVALGFVTFLLKKKKSAGLYKKVWQRLNSFSIGNTVIGIIIMFFTYEQLPFLSMRLWLLLWLVGMAVWLGFIVKSLLQVPILKEQLAKEQEYQKYIP